MVESYQTSIKNNNRKNPQLRFALLYGKPLDVVTSNGNGQFLLFELVPRETLIPNGQPGGSQEYLIKKLPPCIHETQEQDSLAGRTQLGPVFVHRYSTIVNHNGNGVHRLELRIEESLRLAPKNAGLMVVASYEISTEKRIEIAYYSGTSEETIEYFI